MEQEIIHEFVESARHNINNQTFLSEFAQKFGYEDKSLFDIKITYADLAQKVDINNKEGQLFVLYYAFSLASLHINEKFVENWLIINILMEANQYTESIDLFLNDPSIYLFLEHCVQVGSLECLIKIQFLLSQHERRKKLLVIKSQVYRDVFFIFV